MNFWLLALFLVALIVFARCERRRRSGVATRVDSIAWAVTLVLLLAFSSWLALR